MAETITNPLVYYARTSVMTTPGESTGLLKGLPAEIPALCQVVQNNLLHIFWAQRQGVELPEERKQEVAVRRVSTMLARIRAVDDRLLTIPRAPEKRWVGNCRDFSVFLCTLLRHQGVPARARCGFGTYFLPEHYEDHWVCEYWNADVQRWVMVDAQLDDLQVKTLGIDFDPCDVPPDRFIVGGKAWQMCRTGEADPDQFGIFDMHGQWFVQGNLARDLASLNKVEVKPWDCWEATNPEGGEELLSLLDQAAALYPAGNDLFPQLRALYEETRLRVPPVITSFYNGTPQEVDILSGEELLEPVH
jgi:hypothetical protein